MVLKGIGGVDIEFSADGSVYRNTAKDEGVTTDNDGSYIVNLQPGSYNISIIKTDSSGKIIIYILENETLKLTKGQGSASQDFILEKKSVTVTGTTTSEGAPIDNVTLNFLENTSSDIKNNTAIGTSIKSDQNGLFTLELAPGYYNVTGESEKLNDTSGNFSYYGIKTLHIREEDIVKIVTFNLDTLERKELD